MSSTGVPKVVLLCGGMGTRMLPARAAAVLGVPTLVVAA